MSEQTAIPMKMTYRGRDIEDLSRDELIEALKKMHKYYEKRLESEQSAASFALDLARRRP